MSADLPSRGMAIMGTLSHVDKPLAKKGLRLFHRGCRAEVSEEGMRA